MVPGQMAEGLARRISANAEELGGELNAALSTSSWSLSSSSSSASSGPGDRRREDEPSFDPTQAVQTMLDPNHMPTACKVVGSHVENVGPILKLKVVYNGDVTGRELNVPRATMLSALDALESRRTTEECEKDCSGNLSRQLSAIHDNIANDDLETKGTARQMLESVFPSRFPSSFAGRMVAGGLLLSAVVAVIVISVILGQNSDLSSPETTSAPRPTPSFEVDEDGIVTRRGWGALPRRCTVQDLVTPVEYVIIGHTVTDQCNDRPSCATQVRNVQSYHQNIPEIECDIGYNFLVGGDGRVYAGRGWTNVGAHTYNFNQRSIGIAFVGEFTTLHPPEDALRAARALIDAGVQRKYVRPDYKVLGQRQCMPSVSPGDALFSDIQQWTHWVSNA